MSLDKIDGTFLPFLQMVLCFSSGVVYALLRDWGRALYWLAAGVLTCCVTYLLK